MRKVKILIIAFLLSPLSSAQWSGGKLHNRQVIIQISDTLIKASILNEEISDCHSQNKVYYWYSKGMINSNTGGYGGKLLHGDYSAFILNKLIESGQFDKGLKSGRWTYWYLSGEIRKLCNYKNGDLDGNYFSFNEDGKALQEGTYRNGKFYTKNGVLDKRVKRNAVRSGKVQQVDTRNQDRNQNNVAQ